MMKRFGTPILAVGLSVCGFASPASLRDPQYAAQTRIGFEHIYNLDYDKAEEHFLQMRGRYSHHPGPPLYLATIVWLDELMGRQELDLDRFIAPGYFTKPSQSPMPEAKRRRFLDYLADSRRLSESILQQNPGDLDAQYFLGSIHGVMGAFTITIDRSYRNAFGHGKKAYQVHHEIVKAKPEYYDAYMSVGLYEYIVSNLPWYIKWIAVIIGYSGSEERGFDYLEKAARHAQFTSDDARTLQMVLFVREKRFEEALQNARLLHGKYPRNYLLHLNQAQILEKMGRGQEAASVYQTVASAAEKKQPNYHKLSLQSFRPALAQKFLELEQPRLALDQFRSCLEDNSLTEGQRVVCHLQAGRILQKLGETQQAVSHFRRVLEMPEVSGSHSQARRHLAQISP